MTGDAHTHPVDLALESDRFAAPWLAEVVQLLQLRRGSRVALLGGWCRALVRAVAEPLGDGGELLVIEPDPELARSLAAIEHGAVQVLQYAPSGSERFGQFDALLVSALRVDAIPLAGLGACARDNLRPGGRFVVDVPSETSCETLFGSWREAGLDERGLSAWRGPSDGALARAMRGAGLRQVQSTVGTHLLRTDGPRALAEFAVAALRADPRVVDALHLALARRLATHGPADIVFRRTRVHGMR